MFKLNSYKIVKSFTILFFITFPLYRLIKEPLLLIGINDIIFKALLFLIIILIIFIDMIKLNLKVTNNFYFLNYIFLIYIILSFLESKIEYNYNSEYILYIFYDFYFIYFIVILFFASINNTVTRINNPVLFSKYIKKYFYILFYMSLLIGFIQYITNSSLMISSENWMYLTPAKERIRISGLFYTHAYYAAFLTLTATLSFFFIIFKIGSSKKNNYLIFISSIFSLFGTLSKTYLLLVLIFILSILFYKLLHNFISKFIIKYLFLFNLLSSSLIFVIAFNFIGDLSYTREGVFYTNSILQRYYYWKIIYNQYFINADFVHILIGFAIPHTGNMPILVKTVGKIFLTENLILSIYMLNGLVGVFIFLISQYYLWKKMYNTYHSYNDIYSLFFVFYIPIWFYSGLFGRTIGFYSFYVIIPSLLYLYYFYKLRKTE